MNINYKLIWGLLITAAVITLLVLVIVYMNKTTTVENKTTDIINNYNPPDTYAGATTFNISNTVFMEQNSVTSGPIAEFIIDKNWKAGTKASISGQVIYELDVVNTDINMEAGFSINNSFGGPVTFLVDAIQGKYVYLNFNGITTPLNPSDKIELNILGRNPSITNVTATGKYITSTYTPIAE
jgi:hypothetical protein